MSQRSGIILGDLNICDTEEGQFNVWNQTLRRSSTRGRLPCSIHFPHVLEIAQPDYTRRDSTALGIMRTLSRIDRIFNNLPVAEARDFHCCSHVCENLVNRTNPSDHAAARLVIQKPTNRGQQSKRVPSWMSEHPVVCLLFCNSFTTTTGSLMTRSCALAEFYSSSKQGQEADES